MSCSSGSNTISVARYALLRGWARYLCLVTDNICLKKQELIKLRGTDFGIAVDRDIHALFYQILDYRQRRAFYAVGMMGLTGYSIWNTGGWHNVSSDETAKMNSNTLAKYRLKSINAIHLLRTHGLMPCTKCYDNGYIASGDDCYDCPKCRKHGKVPIEQCDS